MAGDPPTKGRSVTRNAGVIAAATLTSRAFGFVRDAAVVAMFGASTSAVFYLAFTIPNMLRRLLAEGSLTVSFVPIFTARLQKDGPVVARRFSDRAFTLAAVALAVIVGLGILAAPAVVWLLADEWRAEPGRFELTVQLTRWVFPYLWVAGIVALAMGVLNSLRRFFIPAFSPVLLNVGLIAGALLFSRWADPPILGLAWGVLVGGVLQVVLNMVHLVRVGFGPRPDGRLRDPDVKRLLWLMGPATFGASIHQVNVLISRGFAASLGEEPVTWLYTADRLVELPMGVLAVSVAMASLPALSSAAADGRLDDYRETLNTALRQLAYVMIPAAVGLIVLAVPIMSVVYQRGEFTHLDARASAEALVFYALGLPAIASARVVVQGFYALEDTRTPVLVGVASVLTFLAGAYLFTGPLGHGGIALAASAAAYVNVLLAAALLRRKVGRLGLRRLLTSLGRSLVGVAVMGAVVWGVSLVGLWEAGAPGTDWATLRNVGTLVLAVVSGAGVYAGVTLLLGSPEAGAVWRLVRRRFVPKAR